MEIGIVLNGLAHVARKQGAWEEARRLYTRSLEINQRYKRKVSIAEAHFGLSEVELAQGDVENAKRLKEIAEDMVQSLGMDR